MVDFTIHIYKTKAILFIAVGHHFNNVHILKNNFSPKTHLKERFQSQGCWHTFVLAAP